MTTAPVVFVVDDDPSVRSSLKFLISSVWEILAEPARRSRRQGRCDRNERIKLTVYPVCSPTNFAADGIRIALAVGGQLFVSAGNIEADLARIANSKMWR